VPVDRTGNVSHGMAQSTLPCLYQVEPTSAQAILHSVSPSRNPSCRSIGPRTLRSRTVLPTSLTCLLRLTGLAILTFLGGRLPSSDSLDYRT
jgi:hypothetical protein